MGLRTALFTLNADLIAQMSCNPAIGGIAKGHIVREIDALGGIMAEVTDAVGIQFRLLNTSRGPAVWSPRAQCDKQAYRLKMREVLDAEPNLQIKQAEVAELLVIDSSEGEGGSRRIQGLRLRDGRCVSARAVILTTGTFLNGLIHCGEQTYPAGRSGEAAAILLGENLKALGLRHCRLKTGTPPRLDGRTIDFARFQAQPGDADPTPFSFRTRRITQPQVNCYIAHTTAESHRIIRENVHRSPMYSGQIHSTGPRYCPSIEDKVVRFADKLSHQIFVEPEGLTTEEIYPNGISTSLPLDVQVQFVRTIKGFEKAHITRPGYAIEYDYFDPRGLTSFLQTKAIANLFFAGQINGTTGYEEAAAQGIIAGMNAALQVQEKELWCPRRDEAYIGVLIDDLITCGTQEPYRMFTSRAEYRLLLREDNADLRLTAKGRELGLVGEARWQQFSAKRDSIETTQTLLNSTWVRVKHNDVFKEILQNPMQHDHRAAEFLKRPEINYQHLLMLDDLDLPQLAQDVSEQVEIQNKYAGYIDRQQQDIEKMRKQENTRLPESLDYSKVTGLSNEVMQKLSKIKPKSLGQAGRISGVTPAALSLLLVHLKKQKVNTADA